MRTLTHRHRRKTGSGPPANALIAWVGTDPYLRDAVTTASHRRESALPLPYRSRSATAAMAVCVVLACGATVGIIEIISHGRAGQHTATPPIAGQDTVVAHRDNPTASGPEALSLIPALPADGASPPRGSYRTLAPMKPMLVEGEVLPSRSEPAPAPPSATASMPSSPDSSVALPRIADTPHRRDNDPEPAATRAQTGHASDAHPDDPAGQPGTPAADKGSDEAAGWIPETDASNVPVPAGPRHRPAPGGPGTSTRLPQGTTAADATDRAGSSPPSPSNRTPTTSLRSDAGQGSAFRSGTGSRTSRGGTGKNRSSGTLSTAH